MSQICLEENKIFQNIEKVVENTLNARLLESSNSLLHDIYESLPTQDKLLLNKQMTPEILQCLQPCLNVNLSLHHNHQAKGNRRIELNPKRRCLGRVGLGKQCSRGRKDDNEFCTAHIRSLPYGRIDGPLEGKALRLRKGRGRRSTVGKKVKKIAYSMNGLNQDDYVKTSLITFEGKEYLVDEYGIFYSNDAQNTIVGQVKQDKIYWFKLS